MISSPNPRPDPGQREPDDTEAHAVLTSLAERHTGAYPPDHLASHVLRVTSGGDWPLARGAMEAALRRFDGASRDDLRVAERPARGDPHGHYRTRRSRERPRPYSTVLRGLEPLDASCDCRDFVRNSLGLCKHVAAVVLDIARRPRKFRQALERAADGHTPRLAWEPVRPLTGRADWLDNVRLYAGPGLPRSRMWQRLARRFARGRLRSVHEDDPARRLALVGDLFAVARRQRQRPAADDPTLVALLDRERVELERRVRDHRGRAALQRALASLERPLYAYQHQGVERFLASGSLLLGDDMGLGKTAQAIAACHALWTVGRVRRGLLIVPASLKAQWDREWALFTDAPLTVVNGCPAQRAEIYRRCGSGFLVANYAQVLRDLELMHAWTPDIVVLDEAQRIKNWQTKTASFVKTLRPPYRLVLTGTPMENRLEELASLMDWADDMALEPKWRLPVWHTVGLPGEAAGARNLNTLRARLEPKLLRRVRRDVLTQLPSRTDTTVPVEMSDAQIEEHDALCQPIARLVHAARRRPLTQAEFLRLMQLLTTQRIICNGLAQLRFHEVWPELAVAGGRRASLRRSLEAPKLDELREIVRQVAIGQGRRIVLFSQWRRMLRLAHWAVEDLLGEHGLRAAFFTGRESQRQRTQSVVDFHDDPDVRLLFASDAGGVGLNLQRAANCCVNLELPWNPAVLEQRVGRIYRIGQTQPIDVYCLVSQDGIEGRIASLVSNKRALFDGLFDGDTDEVRFEGSSSFLTRLKEVFEPLPTRELDSDRDGEDGEDGPETPETTLAMADETCDPEPSARDARAWGRAVPWDAAALGSAVGNLRIEPAEGGGVRIEAPPEAAATLATMLEAMAGLLRGHGPETPPPTQPHSPAERAH